MGRKSIPEGDFMAPGTSSAGGGRQTEGGLVLNDEENLID